MKAFLDVAQIILLNNLKMIGVVIVTFGLMDVALMEPPEKHTPLTIVVKFLNSDVAKIMLT
jgi:hypothetical protein